MRVARDHPERDADHVAHHRTPPPDHPLLAYQHTAGNGAVAALLGGHSPVQRRAAGPRPLRQGDRGPDVTDLQARLNHAGALPALAEDGVFGPLTRAATTAFQEAHGLTPDGVVGPLTRAALDSGDVVPPDPGTLECGCEADDEDADVLELTPGAVAPVAAQLLADVQRDGRKKKRVSTPVPAACRSDARACFSVSLRRAWLLKPGKVVELEVAALGGREGHPTPIGHFQVENKDADHHSSKYKDPKTGKPAPMPHYVNFAPAVGFHAGSLSVESHGCVHLSASAAKAFFDRLNKGDKVDVVK
ncbi:L,D-transpeptidase family protein [Saccharothrix obliqua]|uniref:L,D-transpeptidase family protein n=1 Tax=Saccharothrix obliqua TaxID=2861747 RepID=UPI001C5CDB79|nr:L,D-transpeptidase family protein [Saccharothrix obliqua]MBW4722083.1 L,D-transpeptidase family protein [Saccharothrix obliqua]